MWIDSAIGFFSPSTAYKRIKSRRKIDSIKRKFEAASRSRRTAGWHAASTSANTENRQAITILRNRSRDLVRNNPYANRAVTLIANNVIGKGIIPYITNPNETAQTSFQELWKAWANSKECDFDGILTFPGIQNLVVKSMAESGEVLIRKRISTEFDTIPLRLQVLESDFIVSSEFSVNEKNGNQIVQGIEFDSLGKRIAYHLYENHPGNSGFDLSNSFRTIRVPAEEIIHLFRTDRPGQIRGVPWLSSIMLRLKDFDEFEDAQLVRQKIAAAWSVFITDLQGDDDLSEQERVDLGEKVEPGLIELLPPGRDVRFASPPGVSNYKEYTTTVLHAIAAGAGISYEALTGDLSEVNFSSARMGWLEFQRNIDSWRTSIVNPCLNDTTFKWFLNSSELLGFKPAETKAEWTSPKREMIDPTKEIPAKIKAIRAGIEPLSDVIRQNGGNVEDKLREIAEVNKMLDTLGIILDIDPRKVLSTGKLQDQTNGEVLPQDN